ncbi:DNA-binding protein [Streptomyces viridiviolaceus]|uniref:DNA-binding protein n=1 Tax=Streptomyces viridiviolaceus TaxID=68282 RepID=A0ABW2E1N5_9ACTN|nr:DNA-binding protein [Streptomyces viridiviolaceus]GHB15384.1 DNA-binding protein [Streptomyces viridiviolaceus]
MNDATTRDGATAVTGAEAEELLRAGAVLPPGTTGAGDRAVPMVTQAYRHPGLDGRIVVRLSAAEGNGGPGTGFLGLEPAGEPVEVGLGQPRALGFPEWVLVRHPSDGHLAMSLVEEMNKVARTVRSRPKKARATYESIGERLAGSVPHFLPTFYEQAGRVFLAAGEKAYAAQMFVDARKAETAHALPFDEARMDAVFLEFALADAVPTKVLSGYAKGLSTRVPAATAFRHLRGLFVRLAAHGVAPSSPGATDLRRLAKAVAGRDALAEEMAYLREVLPLPGTVKAPPGWWKAHRAALLELARREPAVRGTLLGLLPTGWEQEELPQWLDLLEKTGATAGLCDSTLPTEERSPDGTAGWTRRFLALCGTDNHRLAPAELYPLVDRLADALRAELAASGGTLPPPVSDVNLLDQLLALRIPLADPQERAGLDLQGWAACDQRRDLVALEADNRFRAAFRRGCPTYERKDIDKRTVTALAESPGGRPMLAEWVADVSRRYLTTELGGFTRHSGPFETLRWLPGEVLATAEKAVREALSTGMAPALARTLRTGILDELSWPAWDEAVGSPASQEAARRTRVSEAWPYLIVLNGTQARVIGAEGTVLSHELRLPDRADRLGADVRYVDGGLLVTWYAFSTSSSYCYWHDADASSPVPVEGDVRHSYACAVDGTGGMNGMPPASLPLPGGGRATGHGVLRRGDTHVPPRRQLISDGTSYWVWIKDWADDGNSAWHAYDPAGDTVGEPGAPDWFGEGLRTAPEGSTLDTAWLLPAPSAVPGPMCAPVDGLLGWRVITLPDGSRRGEDLAGRSVVVPTGVSASPEHALVFPGADRPVTVTRRSDDIRLLDTEGRVIAEVTHGQTAGPFNAGTALLPPLRYWHLLQPRDPQGSAALRRLGDDTAAALLAAAVAEAPGDETDDRDALPGLVRALLPQVGHEALRAGITGVVRFAAEQQRTLDAALARLDSAVQGHVPEEPRPAIGDRLLASALNGVGLTERDKRWYYDFHHYLFGLPQLLARSVRGLAEPAPAGRVHVSLAEQQPLEHVNALALPELPAVLALRAASEATVEEHRQALDAFLAELDAQDLTELDPGHWRRVRLVLDHGLFNGPDAVQGYTKGTVLDLGGGAFLAFPGEWYRFVHEYDQAEIRGRHYGAVYHDPSGRFETPAPYTLVSEEPFVPEPTRASGWVAAFRAELAQRGPVPWRPEAAEEFARLTGLTPTMARLVVAGMPQIDDKREAVPSATLKTIGVKSADARVAKDELRSLDSGALRAVVAALLPTEPSRLWADGPDVAGAAEVWNERLGRRTPIPEEVLHDAVRTVVSPGWAPADALRGFLDASTEPRLTRDLTWTFGRYYLQSAEKTPGFDGSVLKGSVALAAWLAHRLPSGDPIRAALPGVLTALRDRLAHPDLLIGLDRRVDWEAFRRAAGEPTETGDDFVRYGAVVVGTEGPDPVPAVRPALLDAAGHDPHLAALFTGERPNAQETALRLVHDGPFAELLDDPGNPVAGERDEDGLWWPQDPARSVPDLVGEVAERYGIGEDAAVLYLMLLTMPDPTDRNTARWTGWARQRGGAARLRTARAELAATDLVVEGNRSKAGRTLFLPGGWTQPGNPHLPLERWKLPMYDLLDGEVPVLGVVVPTRPVATLYREAWQRVQNGDEPQPEELEVPRPRKRRR